ncbi:Maltose permease [Rasamsonia emersonii CBS 393.64]|uniref:Maltose permease n=1 Tax=Rasamsonia emersonii (strain ATCC 16479 / CBS 393.64 / IMI 116815) TaxID=1408163 RepID=A0A0F4YW13_RASE3|nr:Maltose permease [Rasamsonia emersonii CBS 393.64]KKA22492.1 Maltose permease [Rasamsonia emersonii CBS 393.64]
MADSKRGVLQHWKCLAACSLISMSTVPVFGYEDPKTPIGYNISATRQQLISSLMVLGAFVGSTSAGASISGDLLVSLTSQALYLPRSAASSLFGLLAYRWPLLRPSANRACERAIHDLFSALPAGEGVVPEDITLWLLILLGMLPSSLPRHGHYEDARRTLMWLRPKESNIEEELRGIVTAIEVEKENGQGITFWDLFRNSVDRRRTFLAIAAITTQAASGAIIRYLFFRNGKHRRRNSCILVAVGIVVMMINALFISKIGRRRIFLTTGLILCGLCQLIIAIIYTKDPSSEQTGKAIVGISVIFIIGYNGMVSTYAWVSGGKLPSQRLRSYTFGLAAAMGFLGAWLTTFTAPYCINPSALNWGPKYGYIWICSCFLAAAFVFFFLPEVKNRTLEEIGEMFEARLHAWKFQSYKCKGIDRVVLEKNDEELARVPVNDRSIVCGAVYRNHSKSYFS